MVILQGSATRLRNVHGLDIYLRILWFFCIFR